MYSYNNPYFLVKYLAPDEVKYNTFWRKNISKIPLTVRNRTALRKSMNTLKDPEIMQDKLSKRYTRFQNKLKSKGLEYEIQVSMIEGKIGFSFY